MIVELDIEGLKGLGLVYDIDRGTVFALKKASEYIRGRKIKLYRDKVIRRKRGIDPEKWTSIVCQNENCKKEFVVLKGAKDHRRFCSRRCAALARWAKK